MYNFDFTYKTAVVGLGENLDELITDCCQSAASSPRWVSSTSFGIPFHLLHRLRTPGEEIVFTEWSKIKSQSQI